MIIHVQPLGVRLFVPSLAYSGEPLFDKLTLNLVPGQTTCLLGPSGVGKTTLLRVLAGLETDAQAEIEADDGAPLQGRVAYMAQQDLLLPWLSVRQNAELGRRLRGTPAGRGPDTRELLEKVGLGDRLNDRPATLSGGMRQRVALVRTLAEDRPLVLLDEPFASLDTVTRLELQDLAATLFEQRTVLLVTHDPMEALRLGHRILVMHGRPVALHEAAVPAGAPPRAARAGDLLHEQARLLELLRAPQESGR